MRRQGGFVVYWFISDNYVGPSGCSNINMAKGYMDMIMGDKDHSTVEDCEGEWDTNGKMYCRVE